MKPVTDKNHLVDPDVVPVAIKCAPALLCLHTTSVGMVQLRFESDADRDKFFDALNVAKGGKV